MGVVFAVRGTALDAHYARFSKTAGLIYGGSTSAPTVVSGVATGVFGDSYIAKRNNVGNIRGLVYPGFGNTWSGTGFSILWRIIPRWTGTPSVIMNLCSIGSYSGSGLGKIEVSILTSGAIRVRTANRNQSTLTLNDTTGTTSFTSGTPVDIMFAWDGTTSANAMKVSIDGVELGTMTCASAQSALESAVRTGIIIGAGVDTNHSDYDLNEFVIWDTVESHTYSTRTDFITVPGTGDGQLTAGSVLTGTEFAVPSAFARSTGTFDGSDRWTDPGIANVRSGTAYKANSLTNNRTGTAAIPGASDVKTGVATDATTGTYTGSDRWSDPGEANVLEGVAYKANSLTNNKLGTFAVDYPAEGDVRDGVTYGQGVYEGTYMAPVTGTPINSVAHAAILQRVYAALDDTEFMRIPNPYEVEENSEGVLRKGYGVKIGGATAISAISCNYQTERTFTVVICRESLNTDHNVDGIADVEKQLCEDVDAIVHDFEVNTTLNTGLMFCGFVGDDGIKLLRKRQAYLYIEATFKVKMFQQFD